MTLKYKVLTCIPEHAASWCIPVWASSNGLCPLTPPHTSSRPLKSNVGPAGGKLPKPVVVGKREERPRDPVMRGMRRNSRSCEECDLGRQAIQRLGKYWAGCQWVCPLPCRRKQGWGRAFAACSQSSTGHTGHGVYSWCAMVCGARSWWVAGGYNGPQAQTQLQGSGPMAFGFWVLPSTSLICKAVQWAFLSSLFNNSVML